MKFSMEYLCEVFSYSPETGELRFKTRPEHHFSDKRYQKSWNTRFAGKVTGNSHTCTSGKTYLITQVGKRQIKVHRAIIIMMGHKISESEEVDHIDGNGKNNRIENLRIVNRYSNSRNMKLSAKNKSGVCGVIRWKKSSRWLAYINDKNKNRVYLGYHQNFFDAVCARKSAELNNDYHENHGLERPRY